MTDHTAITAADLRDPASSLGEALLGQRGAGSSNPAHGPHVGGSSTSATIDTGPSRVTEIVNSPQVLHARGPHVGGSFTSATIRTGPSRVTEGVNSPQIMHARGPHVGGSSTSATIVSGPSRVTEVVNSPKRWDSWGDHEEEPEERWVAVKTPWEPFAVAMTIVACLLGLVIGGVYLGMKMEGDYYPQARKGSAVAVITRYPPHHQLPPSFHSAAGKLHLPRSFPPDGNAPEDGALTDKLRPERHLVVWSGKAPHSRSTVNNDLWTFDMTRRTWVEQYDYPLQSINSSQERPLPRWKTGAVRLPGDGMLVFGGDAMGIPQGPDILPHIYLNDMWDLAPAKEGDRLVWRPLHVTHATHGKGECGSPPERRAMVTTLVDGPDGRQQLFMHGGRTRSGGLETDAWVSDLAFPHPCWTQVWPPSSSSGIDKEAETEPEARKGHVAVTIPGRNHSLVWMFGGRNDTKDGNPYKADVWVFNLGQKLWRNWTPKSGPSPSGRDHLGAWYHDGHVFIYGGRGGPDYDSAAPTGEMWAFNLSSRSWRQLLPPSGPATTARFLYGIDTYVVHSDAKTHSRILKEGATSVTNVTVTNDGDDNADNTSWYQAQDTGSRGEPVTVTNDDDDDDDNDDDTSWYQAPDRGSRGEPEDLRVVIFGGEAAQHCYLNDVLELNVRKHEWTELSPLLGGVGERCSHRREWRARRLF